MSPRFNLLPHRQMRREQARQIILRQVVVVMALALGIALAITGAFELHADRQRAFNGVVQEAIDLMVPAERASERQKQRHVYLQQQKRLIESLDARRSTSVLLLSDVAQALPKEISLVRLEENGEIFSLEGKATDNAAISKYFERISKSAYLSGLTMQEIRATEEQGLILYAFLISGRVKLIHVQEPTP